MFIFWGLWWTLLDTEVNWSVSTHGLASTIRKWCRFAIHQPHQGLRSYSLRSDLNLNAQFSKKIIWHPSKLTGQLRVNHDDSSLGSPSHEPYTVLLDGLQNGNLLFIHDRLSLFFSAKWRLGQNSRPSSSFQKRIGSSTKMYIMDIHRLYLIFVFLGG